MRACISDWNSAQAWVNSSSTAGISALCTSGLCQPHYKTLDAFALTLKDTLINVVNMTAHHKFWINNQCCYQNIKWILCEADLSESSLCSICSLTSDMTPHERCLVTGYYYTSGVQLKATDINNTTVPPDVCKILTWPQNCRYCCLCRTTNVAASLWIYMMLYPKRCYIPSCYRKTEFNMLQRSHERLGHSSPHCEYLQMFFCPLRLLVI